MKAVYRAPYRNFDGWRLVTITGVYPDPRRTTRVNVRTINEPYDRFSVFEFQLEFVGMMIENESAPDDAEALYEMNPTSRVIN